MADDEPRPDDEPQPGTTAGKILDAASIAAVVLLLVIAADIWSDGRLISRRLQRGRGDDVERTGD